MIYPIVKYGQKVLETPADLVASFDGDLEKLVADMFETMYAANGVGLAAPQIGVSKRLCVIDVTSGEDSKSKLVLVNPVIVETEGSRVSPTQRLSILNPLPLKSPETRARTPNSFSTSREITCLIQSSNTGILE